MFTDSGIAEYQLLCDGGVGLTVRHQYEHFRLPRRERVERSGMGSAEEVLDDMRVDSRPAAGDVLQGAGEVAHPIDAVFQQVTDSSFRQGQEAARVRVREVLRQHEDRLVRVLLADTQGGLQTVILVARRHADIGDDDVRRKLKACVSLLELWGGLGGPDDRVTDPLE
ncbi:hypothetical protein AAY78_18800 [Microbacterium sp. Ag1]|nr:hypothetical protein AAY78_18800 [Microbacterium sp. Ag1]